MNVNTELRVLNITEKSTESAQAAESGQPSVVPDVSPLLSLPYELQDCIYKFLSYRDIQALKGTSSGLKDFVKFCDIDATSWFKKFPQQTRKTLETMAGSLKNEKRITSLLRQFSDAEHVIETLSGKKESVNFVPLLFFTINQLMVSCRSFDIQEKATIGHGGRVKSATFSSDGRHVVTASHDNTAKIYGEDEHGKWTEKATIVHSDIVRSVTFSLDGSHVVTASYDNMAKIFHIKKRCDDEKITSPPPLKRRRLGVIS